VSQQPLGAHGASWARRARLPLPCHGGGPAPQCDNGAGVRTRAGGSTPSGMVMPGGTTLSRTAPALACVQADVYDTGAMLNSTWGARGRRSGHASFAHRNGV